MKIRQGGYTILEVVLFLAISAGLMTIVFRSFSGRQDTVQFSQAVNDLTDVFRNTANDVQTGFSGEANLKCEINGTELRVQSDPSGLTGQNQACAYLGKVIVMIPDAVGPQKLAIFTVVGRSFLGDSIDTITGNAGKASECGLCNAMPTVVESGGLASRNGVQNLSLTDVRDLPWGVRWGVNPDKSAGASKDLLAVGYINGLAESNFRPIMMTFDDKDSGMLNATKNGDFADIADEIEASLVDSKSGWRPSQLAPGQVNRLRMCIIRSDGMQTATISFNATNLSYAEPTFDTGACNG